MAVSPMKRIYVIAHNSAAEETVKRMQDSQLVQITNIRRGRMKDDFALESAAPVISERQEIDADLTALSNAISFLERVGGMRPGFMESFLNTKPIIGRKEFDKVAESFAWRQVCGEIQEVADEIRKIDSRENELKTKISELSVWSELDVRLSDIKGTERTHVSLGIIQVKEKDAQATLEKLENAMHCRKVWQDRGQVGILVAYALSDSGRASELLKELGFSPVSLPYSDGKPREILDEARKELEKLAEKKSLLLRGASARLPDTMSLKIVYDSILICRERRDAFASIGSTRRTVVVEGWTKNWDAKKIPVSLAGLPAHVYVREPEKDEEIPTEMENKPLIKPFEVVARLYGRPVYFEVDPTPILASFFFIFFGLCMSDVGYGITLCMFSLFVLWRYKPSGGMRLLFKLFFICGISTIIIGFMIGGFFGASLFKPLWFNMSEEPLRFLILALALGIVHLFTGLAIRMYTNVRAGNVKDALLDQALWLLFLSGIVLLAIGMVNPLLGEIGKYVAIVGAVALVLTQGRAKKGIFGKLFSGLLSLYKSVGYLSDVLSYSRLLALGLATGIIAMVFNSIGAMVIGPDPNVLSVLTAAVILVVCHAFNFLLGTMGAFVHTSRLQFVEFFNKFYMGGGRRFEPFRQATKYVIIKE